MGRRPTGHWPKVLFQFGISPGKVQRVGNTRFEFNLDGGAHLDKMANSKHALVMHHTPPESPVRAV
jgi:hypothetical protein